MWSRGLAEGLLHEPEGGEERGGGACNMQGRTLAHDVGSSSLTPATTTTDTTAQAIEFSSALATTTLAQTVWSSAFTLAAPPPQAVRSPSTTATTLAQTATHFLVP